MAPCGLPLPQPGHPESPARIAAVLAALENSGLGGVPPAPLDAAPEGGDEQQQQRAVNSRVQRVISQRVARIEELERVSITDRHSWAGGWEPQVGPDHNFDVGWRCQQEPSSFFTIE